MSDQIERLGIAEVAAREAFGPAELHEPLPPRRPLAGKWDFMVRGWRPATSWLCILILFVHAAFIPLFQLFARQALTMSEAFILGPLILLLKLAHDRRQERQAGITS